MKEFKDIKVKLVVLGATKERNFDISTEPFLTCHLRFHFTKFKQRSLQIRQNKEVYFARIS